MLFPIRDHNPSRKRPYVTWALIAINVAVFLSYIPILNNDFALSAFFDTWAMVPGEITTGTAYHTAITSMFLHGGYIHIISNMLFLWIFGDNVEDAMGHVMFLLFYLASGLGADAIHILSNADSMIPTVGASGAIAGVLGAYLLLYPKAEVDVFFTIVIIFRLITLPAFIVLGMWMGLQLFGSFTESTEGGGVAYWAHTGGFIVGMLLATPLWLKLGGPLFWRRNHGHPPHEPFRIEKEF